MNIPKDSYMMIAECNNCHEEWEEYIPKGTTTENYTTTCRNCGYPTRESIILHKVTNIERVLEQMNPLK